jgi:hypothetical protein
MHAPTGAHFQVNGRSGRRRFERVPMLRMALVVALAAFQLPSAASEWAQPRCAALGVGTRWVLLDVHTGTHTVFAPPVDSVVERVAAFPGCSRIAFTGRTANDPQTLLYTCLAANCRSTLKSIGDPIGFHGDPAIDLSGQWVYFVHNRRASGPMGGHGARAFLEVFRVKGDGTSLTQLTSGNGCHLGPSPMGALGFLFIQTDCRIGKWVERGAVGDPNQSKLNHEPISATEIAVSPDSKLALTSIVHVDTVSIDRISLNTRSQRINVMEFRKGAAPAQAAWGRDSTEFYYWRDSAVMKHTKSQDVLVKALTNSD